jgi:ferredoxin
MSGSCLTCPGIIRSGSVDQSDGILEPEQLAKGYMLTCVSYPKSDLEVEIIHEDDLP